MRLSPRALVLLVCLAVALAASQTPAQQVTVSTPFQTLSESYFERTGVGFNFNLGGRGGPAMAFGRPFPGGVADPGAMMRNTLDTDHGRSSVVGMVAPGVFAPGASIPFSQNSYGLAVPQFGGYDPSAGLTSGFNINHGGFNGSFNWTAGQGNRRTFVSQTPSVTLTNGVPGSISDSSLSPFVIGVIPVVGGFSTFPAQFSPMAYPGYSMGPMVQPVPMGNHRVQAMRQQMAANMQAAVEEVSVRRAAEAAAEELAPAAIPRRAAPHDAEPSKAAGDASIQKLAAAQSSSAGRAVPSVAESRRLRQLEQAGLNDEAMVWFERGRTAEEGGKVNVAKVFYKRAADRASDKLRRQVQARLDALNASTTP